MFRINLFIKKRIFVVLFFKNIKMDNIIATIVISGIIILIAVFLLGFRIFLFKDGEFPNIHIGGSKALENQGVSCATTQDAEAQKSKSNVTSFVKELKIEE
jgi:hypothetical protein